MKHFLDLASRGALPSASSGQYAAFVLAEKIIDLVPRLDGEAADGLVEFIQLVRCRPGTAGDLLERGAK